MFARKSMNLKNIYNTAYNDAPFEGIKKNAGEFFFSTILLDLLENLDNEEEITYIEFLCYLLNNAGISLPNQAPKLSDP